MAQDKKTTLAGLPLQRIIPVTVFFDPQGDDATVEPFTPVPIDFGQSLDFSDLVNSDLLPGL